jgi:hypothetical protein
MFWRKLGTSRGVEESGTIEMIDQFVAAGEPASLLYSLKQPIEPDPVSFVAQVSAKVAPEQPTKRAIGRCGRERDGGRVIHRRTASDSRDELVIGTNGKGDPISRTRRFCWLSATFSSLSAANASLRTAPSARLP